MGQTLAIQTISALSRGLDHFIERGWACRGKGFVTDDSGNGK